jgi:ElaB/YqjD/DUF883 family membrane-anchored ribosome-binding protein
MGPSKKGHKAMKPSQITDDLKSARDGVAEAAQQLKKNTVKATKSAVKDAERKLDDINAEAHNYLQSAEKRVKARPAESLAIAFAAGVVLSLVLGRR